MTARVHALIVNYNGWRDTIDCLESVCKSDYSPLDVIVVDNASRDGSSDHIRKWCAARTSDTNGARVHLIQLSDNFGFAGGNNAGLRYMLDRQPDAYAWLVNNDTVVAADALRRMVEHAERDPAIGAVGATILRHDAPERVESAAGGTFAEWHGMTRTIRSGTLRSAPRPPIERIDYISGTCMLVPLRTVKRVGLLDERYFLYAEDIDWSARFREAGYRLAYCAEAEIWHKGGASTVHGSSVHDYHNVKSSLLLVHKRRPALLPLALAYSIGRCVLPKVLRGEWARLPAVARGYLDFIRQVQRGGANRSPNP